MTLAQRSSRIAIVMLVISCLHLEASVAQDAEDSGGLQEIVVTAEKRANTAQKTPISITALSGADLSDRGIVSTDGLATVTPGLTIQKEVIGKVVIRGVGTENYTVGSDPGVAIHKDGLYVARSSVSIFDLFDVNRVEVLRGPQGTLYGRNATGGVINILSNEPTDTLGGYATADVGNYDKRRIEAALNLPFGAAVETRLSILYARRDGYTKNIFPGLPARPADPASGFPGVPAISNAASRHVDQLDNQDLFAARAQIKLRFNEDLSLLLSGEISRDKSLPPAFKYFDRTNAYWFNLFGPDQALSDPRRVSQDFANVIPGTNRTIPSVGKADQSSGLARLTWNLDGMTFTSLSGYRRIDFSWLDDGDGFDQLFVNYFQTDASRQFSQEFQLASQGDGKFAWILGAFYLNEKAITFTGIPFLDFAPNPAAPYLLWDGHSNTKAYAVYGQGTFSFTDRARGTLGLRYNKEKKDGDLTYNPFGLLGNPPPTNPLSGDWQAVTPKFGLEVDIAHDVLGYVSATRGFKSGGFNLLAVQKPYNPEYLWAYELGVKSKSLDGRLIANLSAFYYDYKDLQVGKVVNLSATVVNAARAKIKGAELELRALPGAGFEMDAGTALLDARYGSFVTEDPAFSGNPGAPGDLGCGSQVGAPTAEPAPPNRTISLAGCRLPRSPRLQANLGVQWSTVLGTGLFRIRGDWAQRSKQYFTQFNRDVVSQGGYGTLGARITYAGADERWSVSAYGDNLANKEYYATVLESGVALPGTVVPQAVYGAPRTFGIVSSIRY